MAGAVGYPSTGAMMEHPEVSSLKGILNAAKILALVLMIIAGLWALGTLAVDALAGPFFLVAGLGGVIYLLLSAVVQFLIWQRIPAIEAMVNNRQYREARDATTLWMILGFVFLFLNGIVLLIAYVKFEPIIATGGAVPVSPVGGYGPAPGYGPQPPLAGAPPAGPSPPTAGAPQPVGTTSYQYNPTPAPAVTPAPAAAPGTTPCPRCGRPLTWIPQYSRWYCYSDGQYA